MYFMGPGPDVIMPGTETKSAPAQPPTTLQQHTTKGKTIGKGRGKSCSCSKGKGKGRAPRWAIKGHDKDGKGKAAPDQKRRNGLDPNYWGWGDS